MLSKTSKLNFLARFVNVYVEYSLNSPNCVNFVILLIITFIICFLCIS